MEDELIKIWQSSSNEERIKFEKSKLMIELQSSLGRLHRWWKYLELVDVISVLITIPGFIFIVYHAPFTSTKIASVLVIIWAVNYLIRVLGIKKFKPSDLEENYLEYLKKSRVYLEAQRNLLETYKYWGMTPLYPIIFLFVVDFWEIPSKRIIIVILFLNMVGMHIFAYFFHKRRVKNEINPRIKRVNEVIESLEK